MNSPQSSPQLPTSTGSNAMQAFRRGIDRRAYVLARAQCGDSQLLQSALIGVDSAFKAEYAELPISQWPIRFWTLLLSRKELAQGQSPWPALASISHGPRAALLLRLVAGLDFPHAAQVLNISETTYRFALERGLEQLHDAGFNFQELERLRDTFFEEVKQLPSEVIQPQQAAETFHAIPEAMSAAADKAGANKRPPALWRWLVLLVALVLAVCFGWWQTRTDEVSTATLLALSDVQNAVIHPDYELITRPEVQTQAQDLALLSWIAAGAPEENFEVLKSGEISMPREAAAGDADAEAVYEN